MITSGEVGAVFRIIDEASPALRRIMEQMKALQLAIDRTKASLKDFVMPPGLNRALGITLQRFGGIADASKVAGDAVTSSFAKMDTSIKASAANMASMGREMRAIGAESRAIGGNLRYGGVGRGGSHGSPIHFGGSSVGLPGDQHMRLSGGPALAGAAAIAYGAYEEAKVQDFVNKIFLTGGITSGTETSNPLYTKIRDAILKSYTMTGLPLEQIEEGILTGTRGLAGISLEKRLALMPQLLAASSTEAYLKDGTTIPEAMQAFVGLAHMEGKYSPEEIGKLADHFAYLSTTTPVTVKQVESAASYAIPMLRTANFDPEQVLLMITSMERAGITNTKAGTWISQLATQSFPGTSLMSKMLFKKHEAALKMLGLVDDYDNPTWFTNGAPDLVKMTGIAGDAISKMDPAHRLAVEKALWGQQGGRAAGFFADPTNRAIMGAVANDEKNFISGETMWKQSQTNSPIVQFRIALAGLNVELINLGSNVLPFVTTVLRGANDTLGGKGELAAGGAGLAAWMFRSKLASGASSLARLLPEIFPALGISSAASSVGSALGIFGLLAATNPNRQDPMSHIEGGQAIWARSRASQAALHQGADMEAARGKALGALSIPPPVVNIKNDVKVFLDSSAIAARVESKITKDTRTVTGSSDFDNAAAFKVPDMP